MWITIIAIFFLTLYLFLLWIFYHGWLRIPSYKSYLKEKPTITITVIVACRNEEKNLPALLNSLQKQTLPDFELLLIDDHSTDATWEIMQRFATVFRKCKAIKASDHGKKNAIKEAISIACGELILMTDADCQIPEKWVAAIGSFQQKEDCDLIICPVKLRGNNTFFSNLEQLEFMSLVASGAGAAGAGMPIMCNGANLAFKRDTWIKNMNALRVDEPSGDDIFLLLNIKKEGGKIRFLKSENALVVANATKNLTHFGAQRTRWTAKAKHYTDWQIISVAIIILCLTTIQIALIVASVFSPTYLRLTLLVFVLKFLGDYLFLKMANSFFHHSRLFMDSILLSIVYPFYIVSTVFLSLFRNKKRW